MTPAGSLGADQGTDQGLTRARRQGAATTIHGITAAKSD
jgi:hypothetical protein